MKQQEIVPLIFCRNISVSFRMVFGDFLSVPSQIVRQFPETVYFNTYIYEPRMDIGSFFGRSRRKTK